MSAGRRERTTHFRKPEGKYFCAEDWTVESALKLLAKFRFLAQGTLWSRQPRKPGEIAKSALIRPTATSRPGQRRRIQ